MLDSGSVGFVFVFLFLDHFFVFHGSDLIDDFLHVNFWVEFSVLMLGQFGAFWVGLMQKLLLFCLIVTGGKFEMLLFDLLLNELLIFFIIRWRRVLRFAVIRVWFILKLRILVLIVRFLPRARVFLCKWIKVKGVRWKLSCLFVVGAHKLL